MSTIAFSKSIGPVPLHCFLSESHESTIEITDNPIESGANVNDHAYLVPKTVTLEVAEHNAAATYNALVAFQKTRIPFTLVTGLKVYRNMLIKSITPDRDKDTSQIFQGSIELQEVQIVKTAVTSVDVQESGATPAGEPGGANSTGAVSPSPQSAGDSITADRVAGTLQRGDSPTLPVSGSISSGLDVGKSLLQLATGL